MASESKVRVRKRANEEENGSLGVPVKRVPENESEEQSRERKQREEKDGVVNNHEYEYGHRESQKEQCYRNVQKHARNGVAATAMAVV